MLPYVLIMTCNWADIGLAVQKAEVSNSNAAFAQLKKVRFSKFRLIYFIKVTYVWTIRQGVIRKSMSFIILMYILRSCCMCQKKFIALEKKWFSLYVIYCLSKNHGQMCLPHQVNSLICIHLIRNNIYRCTVTMETFTLWVQFALR